MNPLSDISPQNEIAQLLASRKDEITKSFDQMVRQSVAGAKGLEYAALVDHLPDFIDIMIEHLNHRELRPVESAGEKRVSRAHGDQRATIESYTVEQLLAEYRIFRRVVFEALERNGHQVPRNERDTMLELIQLAAKHAASEFIHTRISKTQLIRWLPQHALIKFVIAMGLVAIATLIQWSLRDSLQGAPFTIYYPMVIIASFIANPIFVTILAAIAAQYFFLEPLVWGQASDLIPLALFIFNGIMISLVIERVRRSQSEAAESSNEQAAAKHEVEIINQKLETEQLLREQFVNTLSHDMRSPLTTIKMSAQMLIRKPDQTEIQNEKMFGRILQNVERIDDMIRDLLDVSRIRAGQPLPIACEYIDLYPLIDDLVDELKLVHGDRFIWAGEKNVEGEWSADAIRRMTENLAANAIKYGAADKPVEIRLETTHNFVRIVVHNELIDPSQPLNKEDIELLFRPFQRTREAHASGKKGWGLGLTLVKGLAEAHGGSVKVESTGEGGTTFTVMIPR